MDLFDRAVRTITVILLGVLCFCIFTMAEDITLTTYYPAPNGSYVQLTVTETLDVTDGLVIGSNYAGTETAPENGMIIEGNVGIGVVVPTEALDVNGTVNATGFSASGTTGWSGSYSTGGGPETITVTNGLITDVT